MKELKLSREISSSFDHEVPFGKLRLLVTDSHGVF